MTKEIEPFLKLFDRYKGKVYFDGQNYCIEAVNELKDYWGKIHKKKCKIEVRYDSVWHIFAEEESLEILGGMGTSQDSLEKALEIVKAQLDKYCFQKRFVEEMKLF